MTRSLFAGASTPVGFVNFFDQIMPLEQAKERYFLKGASGSGKSTFLKRIAAAFEGAGFDTERFHCSNDADSLDAVSVAERGVCITDATAPHARDPELPVAVDIIIDFAAFIDAQQISRRADTLQALKNDKALLTKKAAGYLAAAGSVYMAEAPTHSPKEPIQECIELLKAHAVPDCIGANRSLFASAVTPDGFISFAAQLFAGCTIYDVEAQHGTSLSLAKLGTAASALGLNTESFHNPFAPDRLEYLHLPAIETVFSASAMNHAVCKNQLWNSLIDAAVAYMRESRAAHAQIEEIYASAVDFKQVDAVTETMIDKLLA